MRIWSHDRLSGHAWFVSERRIPLSPWIARLSFVFGLTSTFSRPAIVAIQLIQLIFYHAHPFSKVKKEKEYLITIIKEKE